MTTGAGNEDATNKPEINRLAVLLEADRLLDLLLIAGYRDLNAWERQIRAILARARRGTLRAADVSHLRYLGRRIRTSSGMATWREPLP